MANADYERAVELRNAGHLVESARLMKQLAEKGFAPAQSFVLLQGNTADPRLDIPTSAG